MLTLTHLNSLDKKPVIQTRLSINSPGDQYEQEADAMADKIMLMPSREMHHQPKPITGLIGRLNFFANVRTSSFAMSPTGKTADSRTSLGTAHKK